MRKLLLVLLTLAADAGQVLSRLVIRDARTDSRPDLRSFKLSLQRLKCGPNGVEMLHIVLKYLQRDRVCLWDPTFLAISTTDGGLDCLLTAGFSREVEKDEESCGTPYLVRRRTSPHAVREFAAAASSVLVEAEAEADHTRAEQSNDGREEEGVKVARHATTVMSASASIPPGVVDASEPLLADEGAPDRPVTSGAIAAAGSSRGRGEADGELPQRAIVQQISSMISGLIQELERQATVTFGNDTDAASSNDTLASRARSPPIHFRVYRSPGFPGMPPTGGLPFLPSGLGGGGLGDSDEEGEVPQLERRLRQANLPAEAEDLATRELRRLRRMSPMHSEYSTLVDYLEWIAELTWSNSSIDRLTISAAKQQLESDHYGMERVKQRVLEYLSVCKLKGDLRGSILCLLGPPGIGKTSLGRSVADALHRDFYRVSLGGVHSEAEIRGHRRTYVGAMPGLILQALKKCKTNNCVIMLDEVDKLGKHSLNGDPSSALLEVLDPEQNHG